MNFAVIPLLIVALVMLSTDTDVESAELLLRGAHQVEHHDGALIVGDAIVTIPRDTVVPGPVYVIGGDVTVEGAVKGDLVQLAGTVTVEPGSSIGGELQHLAGTLTVSPAADVGRRTSLVLGRASDQGPGVVPGLVLILVLAGAGALLAGKHGTALTNVAESGRRHPIITLTVGIMLTLTATSLLAFMAFTLVLLPVAGMGAVVGLLALGYGLISVGHLVGGRLPLSRRWATFFGVVIVMAGLRFAGLVPFFGDLVVGAMLFVALGAVVVSYFGAIRFRPASLGD